MIVFQVKGQSHRLSTLKGKEKDVIKNFSTYSTKYTEDTEALGRQLSQARSKPDPVDRVLTAHYIGVHMVYNYDAQQHRAGQIISGLETEWDYCGRMGKHEKIDGEKKGKKRKAKDTKR